MELLYALHLKLHSKPVKKKASPMSSLTLVSCAIFSLVLNTQPYLTNSEFHPSSLGVSK